jgi:hypothetical protein
VDTVSAKKRISHEVARLWEVTANYKSRSSPPRFLEAYFWSVMNMPNLSIRITGPTFVEGRVISALALQHGMRHLFYGHSASLFKATASRRRRP